MDLRALLEKCSDMQLHCGDGRTIHANAFTLLSCCTVLQHLYQDVGEYAVISVPMTESDAIQLAVDIIHGLRTVAELTLAEVELCCRGFEFLGCTILWKKLHARLWALVSKEQDPAVILMHSNRLLATDTYARDVLNKFKSVCPKWEDFKEIFQHITLSESIAILMMWRLCKYFPAHLVFDAIIDAFPASLLTVSTCIKIFGAYRTGVYHHPDEVVVSMNKIVSKCSGEDLTAHLQTITDALCKYESLPGSKLTGTVVTFLNEPKTSVLVKIYEPFTGTKSLKVKRLMHVVVNTQQGTLGGTLDVGKLDDNRFYPTTIMLRITAYRSEHPNTHDTIDATYRVTELWREYKDVDHFATIHLDMPDVRHDTEEALLQSTLRDIAHLRYIRLDFFYGHGDIRQLAVF